MMLERRKNLNTNELDIHDYLEILRKNKIIIILFSVFCVLITILISIVQDNIYKASAVLLVDKESANVLNVQDVVTLGGSNYRSYKEYLQTQIGIIKSRNVVKRVFDNLNLIQILSSKKTNHNYSDDSFVKKKIIALRDRFVSKVPFHLSQKSNDYELLFDFQKNIKISHIRDTRLLSVSYEHKDPILAAEIVNELIRVYIKKNLELKINASRSAVLWLSHEVDNLRNALKEKEKLLQDFRKQNNIISADERREIMNKSIIDLSQKLTEAESRFAENKKRYRLKHPKMQQLMDLISSLNNKLQFTRQESIAFEEKLIKYNELVREVDLTKKLLENVLTREKETLVSGSIKSNNISIIEDAIPPYKKNRPKRKLNILLSFIVGIFGGVGLAFLIEFFKKHIHNSEDFLKFNIPFLGYIPVIKKSIFDKNNFQDNYILLKHKGVISEIFNKLRTSVILKAGKKEERGKSIVLTSFLPHEGKTFVACNLSVTLAKYNFKVLILEADLRRSRMKNVFETKHQAGISDYLLDKATLEEVIQKSPLKNLDLLLNYTIPDNPSELLGTDRFKELLPILEQKYDIIFIDAPPVFAVTDPIILTAMAKNVIIISKYNHTPKSLVPAMKEKLDSANANILGAIINQVKDTTSTEYNSTSYYGKEYIQK